MFVPGRQPPGAAPVGPGTSAPRPHHGAWARPVMQVSPVPMMAMPGLSPEVVAHAIIVARAALRQKYKVVTVEQLANHLMHTLNISWNDLSVLPQWQAEQSFLVAVDQHIDALLASALLITYTDIRAFLQFSGLFRTGTSLEDFEQVYGPLLHRRRIREGFNVPDSVLHAGAFPINPTGPAVIKPLCDHYATLDRTWTTEDDVHNALQEIVRQLAAASDEAARKLHTMKRADKAPDHALHRYAGIRVQQPDLLVHIIAYSDQIAGHVQTEVEKRVEARRREEVTAHLYQSFGPKLDQAFKNGLRWVEACRSLQQSPTNGASLLLDFFAWCRDPAMPRLHLMDILMPLAAMTVMNHSLQPAIHNSQFFSAHGQQTAAMKLATAIQHVQLPAATHSAAESMWKLMLALQQIMDSFAQVPIPVTSFVAHMTEAGPRQTVERIIFERINGLFAQYSSQGGCSLDADVATHAATLRAPAEVVDSLIAAFDTAYHDSRHRFGPRPTDWVQFLVQLLVQAEAIMIQEYNAGRFVGTHDSQTFLAFLLDHTGAVANVVHDALAAANFSSAAVSSGGTQVTPSRTGVYTIIQQACESLKVDEGANKAQLDQVAETVCAHFGVSSLDCLGLTDIQAAIVEAKCSAFKPAAAAAASTNIKSAVCLTAPLTTTPVSAAVHGRCDKLLNAHADTKSDDAASLVPVVRKAVRAAPLMKDLAVHLRWGLVFQPRCGTLSDFLHQHAAAFRDLPIVHTPCDQFLLVAAPSTDAQQRDRDLESALVAADGPLFIARVIGILFASSLSPEAVVQLMSDCVRTWLRSASPTIAAAVLLDMLTVMPECYVSTLSKALCACADMHLLDWQATLLKLAHERHNDQCLSAVHRAGMILAIQLWQADLDTWLFSTAPRAQAVDPVPSSSGVRGSSNPRTPTAASPPTPVVAAQGSPSLAERQEPEAPMARCLTLTPAGRSAECDSLCDAIGRDEFGLWDPHESIATRNMRTKTQGAVERLAGELYTKNLHYVLELLQNADDNRYAPGVTPTLAITLTESELSFENNEMGFREADVRSLSNVNSSTKKGSSGGYIGNKGIGFKSVFIVTTRPRIHSGPYHFEFNSRDPDMRYILPRSVRVPDEWNPSTSGTVIVLPLEADLSLSGAHGAVQDTTSSALHLANDLSKQLRKVRPEVLMFLPKLRVLSVDDRLHRCHRYMARQDEPCPLVVAGIEPPLSTKVVQLSEVTRSSLGDDKQETAARWWLFSRTLRIRVETDRQTDVVIGFRDLFGDDVDDHPPQLEPCDVYAFLPLRSYGLPFMVQADFEVPAARESIDEKKRWNEYLLSAIPGLYVDAVRVAVMTAQSQPSAMTAATAVCRMLSCVPVPSKAMEAFRELPVQISRALRDVPCIPVGSGFVVPANAVLWKSLRSAWQTADEEHLATVTLAYLAKLGKALVDPELAAALTEESAATLGIRLNDADLLAELLRQAVMDWKTADDVDYDWLVWLLTEMQLKQSRTTVRRLLESIAYVPLLNGNLVQSGLGIGQKVYYVPPSSAASPVLCAESLSIIQDPRVRICDPRLVTAFSKVVDLSFFSWLGFDSLHSQSFIDNCVVPCLVPNDDSEPLELGLAIRMLQVCMAVATGLSRNPAASLLSSVGKAGGRIWLARSDETVHATPVVGVHMWHLSPADDLRGVIPSHAAGWDRVSAAYVRHCTSDAELFSWAELFEGLGVTKGLAFPPVVLQLQATVRYAPVFSGSQWTVDRLTSTSPEWSVRVDGLAEILSDVLLAHVPELCPQPDSTTRLEVRIKVSDYGIAELRTVLSELRNSYDGIHDEAYCLFCQYVVQVWTTAPYVFKATMSMQHGEHTATAECVSSVAAMLQQYAWMPARLLERSRVCKPPEILCGQAVAYLGMFAPHCVIEIPDELARFLGMLVTPKSSHIQDALRVAAKHLVGIGADSAHIQDQLGPMYRLLSEMPDAVADVNVVFTRDAGLVPPAKAVLRDPTGGMAAANIAFVVGDVFERAELRRYLAAIGLHAEPTTQHYLSLLMVLSSKPHSDACLQQAWSALSALCAIDDVVQLAHSLVVPTLDGAWHRVQDVVCFAEHGACECKGVQIPSSVRHKVATVPPHSAAKASLVAKLYQELGLSSIKAHLVRRAAPIHSKLFFSGLSFLPVHVFAFALQDVLRRDACNDALMRQYLLELSVELVDQLYEVYTLLGVEAQRVPTEGTLSVNSDNRPTLYIVYRAIQAEGARHGAGVGAVMEGNSPKSTSATVMEALWSIVTDATNDSLLHTMEAVGIPADRIDSLRKQLAVMLKPISHAYLRNTVEQMVANMMRTGMTSGVVPMSLVEHIVTEASPLVTLTAAQYWFGTQSLFVESLCKGMWLEDLWRRFQTASVVVNERAHTKHAELLASDMHAPLPELDTRGVNVEAESNFPLVQAAVHQQVQSLLSAASAAIAAGSDSDSKFADTRNTHTGVTKWRPADIANTQLTESIASGERPLQYSGVSAVTAGPAPAASSSEDSAPFVEAVAPIPCVLSVLTAKAVPFAPAHVPHMPPTRTSAEFGMLLGRWGEQFAFNALRSNTDYAVTWCNAENESGLPFDLKLTIDGVEHYVEVKSTTKSTVARHQGMLLAHFSVKHLQFASLQNQTFLIVCAVYDAEVPELFEIRDLGRRLNEDLKLTVALPTPNLLDT